MKTFSLSYKIEEGDSWRAKESIKIKSNLADDPLIECQLSKSLIESLKTEAAILEPDKLILAIAEAQKREIQSNIEALNDMQLTAKINADKAHEALIEIALDSENKYIELEKSFLAIRKRFTDNITETTKSIEKDLEKLSSVEEKLSKIDNWKLEALNNNLTSLISIIEKDPELAKLVLDYKVKSI